MFLPTRDLGCVRNSHPSFKALQAAAVLNHKLQAELTKSTINRTHVVKCWPLKK